MYVADLNYDQWVPGEPTSFTYSEDTAIVVNNAKKKTNRRFPVFVKLAFMSFGYGL